ncbi:MAG: DUF1553 domain-containing protein [Bacteroidota bacterium]|nr:DUF1553 domain-containing protein [Bacteroidota bacterium]
MKIFAVLQSHWRITGLSIIFLLFTFVMGFEFFNREEISYNKHIRPIFNANCTGCHGGVKKAGGISFIYREEALGKGQSGKPCIIPGDPENSELVKRIEHHDKQLKMPLGKPALTEEQMSLIKKWIKQGAKWEEHWAYVAPITQKVPESSDKWIKNSIDNFILAKLDEQDLSIKPQPEADRSTLIRRVSLDLTGLPPTLEQTEAFVNDPSENAYEKVVDNLLASPAYGERWTAMWLDLARFADTKGYEKDQFRNIWRYRDYLIKSFNNNKPYNVFLQEQLAGDLMSKPTEEQIIATAFHRNTLNNDEGGTDNEEFRTAAVIDRVNTTFDVTQGITMGCVQCHSHPYDPIPHKDYYKFMAFLNNTMDEDHFDEIPNYISVEDTPTTRIKELMVQIDKLNNYNNKNESYEQMKRRHSWPRVQAEHAYAFKNVNSDEHYINISKEGYVMYKNIDFSNVESIKLRASSVGGSAAELHLDSPNGEKIAKFEVPENFGEWFEYGEYIKPIKGKHDLYMVFKTNSKGFCNSSVDYLTFYQKSGDNKLSKVKAGSATDTKDAFKQEGKVCCWKPGGWISFWGPDLTKSNSISINYEAVNGFNIEIRNGKSNGEIIASADLGPTNGQFVQKSFPIKPISKATEITFVFNKTKKGACDGMLDWIDFNSGANQNISPKQEKINQQVSELKKELHKYLYAKGIPIMRELPEGKKRITRVFHRGNWMAKTDTVTPDVPNILNKMPKNAPKNRLGMAQWLTSTENPLTARVAVNRFWEQLFGYGIVETLEDFGTQGSKPTHPELLDYLAIKFQTEYNWDIKKLLKFYVMSATYRQASEATENHIKQDPRNRYLARGPRVRLTSEQIRDQALAVSGLLSKKMYGPSVMPYQPEGIWQTVYNGANWETSEGEDRYRRMLYTFMRRSAPYPNMLTFDGPSREFCMVRRIRTNTPLQALATLNDTTFIEASQALAKKMISVKDTSIKSKIAFGFKVATLQNPNEKSLESLIRLFNKAQIFYTKNNDYAYKMSGTMQNSKELASYTLVANAILNTDQFITKE